MSSSLREIIKRRSAFLSAMVILTSRAIAMVETGIMRQVMTLLMSRFPEHVNERCFDFIALMYLIRCARKQVEIVPIVDLDQDFIDQVKYLQLEGVSALNIGNQISQLLNILFEKHRFAAKSDKEVTRGQRPSSRFREEYCPKRV